MVTQTIRLPFARSTPSIARTKLAGFLTINRAPSPLIEDALIVVSEMIANAVSHGAPDGDGMIEISWDLGLDMLELCVTDGGETTSLTPIEFDEDSLGGRGLSIINKVADRWWVEADDGTRVHAELAVESS